MTENAALKPQPRRGARKRNWIYFSNAPIMINKTAELGPIEEASGKQRGRLYACLRYLEILSEGTKLLKTKSRLSTRGPSYRTTAAANLRKQRIFFLSAPTNMHKRDTECAVSGTKLLKHKKCWHNYLYTDYFSLHTGKENTAREG